MNKDEFRKSLIDASSKEAILELFQTEEANYYEV
jgi:mannitol/fructose-specific phosphotransferase system IIA component (Ntr-type)